MKTTSSTIDRRKFLRGAAGFALSLPSFETFAGLANPAKQANKKRFASFYMPDGVPMPRKDDPAFQTWSWFPHGQGKDFKLTKCLQTLEPLRNEMTVLSGLSHPAVRSVHGHSNADQFLTGADTGGSGDYQNSISLDQVFAEHVGEHTRISSLVVSTDGGTGSPRGSQTMSYNRNGRPIPAEHKPKRIFDMLFAKSGEDAARKLAMSNSALDLLLDDARSLKKSLSANDQKTLDDYLQSVRDTEVKVEKAKHWINTPFTKTNVDHLQLEISPDDPRDYLRTMYELIYLAFRTDTTRVATYQIGRENGVGISDHLARAVGFKLSHQLSHQTKEPDGWKNFGIYCRFLSEEFGRFADKLKATPEPGGESNMLDNTLLFFGSASSAFHLSRNYPLMLVGGKKMGFKHGQFLDYAGTGAYRGGWALGDTEPWKLDSSYEDLPLSNLYVTMLHRLGVPAKSFADSTGELTEV
jgi:hypothetical protein